MLKSIVFSLAIMSTFSLISVAGPLNPPGPPAPTMKTLDQVEPRILISQPIVINQPGSYVVTNNISAPGEVIQIAGFGQRISIDLNGFELERTGAGPVIISFSGHLTIRNGRVRSAGGYALNLQTESVIVEDLEVYGGGLFAYHGSETVVRDSSWLYCGPGIVVDTGNFGTAVVENNALQGCGITTGPDTNGVRIVRNTLHNGRMTVGSDGSLVLENTVTQDSGTGLLVTGSQNHIEGNVLVNNSGHGLRIEGSENVYRRNTARGNTLTNFANTGTGNTSAGDNFMPGLM